MDSGPWDSPNVESLGQTSNVATSKIFASQLEEILSELSQSTAVSPDVLSRLQQVKQGLEMEDQERSLKEDLERQREAEAQNEINQLVQLVSEYEQKLEEMGTENYQLRDAVEDLKLREQDEAEHRQQLANNRLQELHDQYLKMESDFEDKLKGFQIVEKRVQELEEQLYEKDTKLRELM